MLSVTTAAVSLALGAAAGLRFNLLFALVTAAAAAAVSGYPRAPRARVWWAAVILLAGWAAGDGINAWLAFSGSGAVSALGAGAWVGFAVRAGLGLALGYVVPALLGAYVGRQVHKGTGYLSAGAVAVMVVPALAQLGTVISAALQRAVG